MSSISPTEVVAALALYAALTAVMSLHGRRIDRSLARTFAVLGGAWAATVFVANYLLHLAGVMSFLPWVNNFLHSFVWIGLCLPYLYLGMRTGHGLLKQCLVFATFSLVVKYAEQLLFGTWELDHFFWVIDGNTAYVLGWSLADGLYPVISLHGLRLLARVVPGLLVV